MAEFIIKASDITISKKINNIPGDELDTTATGLFLADDSTDPTSSTLSAQADLVDGDLQTVISGSLTSTYSIGLDLGSSKTIQKLFIYDVSTNNAGVSQAGVNDTFTVYSSADNSTWVLIEIFKPLNRVVYLDTDSNPSPIPSPLPSPLPYDTVTDPVYRIDLVFESKPTARYFKAYASRDNVQDVGSSTLQISEMEALTQPSLTLDTNLTNDVLTVQSIVSTNPISVPGDGTGDNTPAIT